MLVNFLCIACVIYAWWIHQSIAPTSLTQILRRQMGRERLRALGCLFLIPYGFQQGIMKCHFRKIAHTIIQHDKPSSRHPLWAVHPRAFNRPNCRNHFRCPSPHHILPQSLTSRSKVPHALLLPPSDLLSVPDYESGRLQQCWWSSRRGRQAYRQTGREY